ncbi:OmpA family protein [Lysobacter firmicutimachus]|uniref:OmpA family protein n=1 Tax=Lysobacter firmicutimachus TaxID=1792846 RepID=A0AAU8MUS6_9GAMM
MTLAKALTSESGTQAGIAEAGETLTYTITLSNSGGTAASYDLSDTLSAGLTYVSSTPGGSNAGQTTTWTALSVPANGTLQVTVVATVNTPIASADVRNLTKRTGDPDPACPSSTCVVTPTAGAVTLAKALTSESGTQAGIAEAGETLTYTITLSNSGGTAASYDLSDTLSAGLTYVSSTPGGSNAGQTTTWTALSVPANGTLQVTVVATVNTPIASADVRNLTKRTGDPDPACPSSTCVVTPTAGAVTLAKALTSESGTQAGIAEAGETLTYTITLSNSGGTAASYDLSDTLSAGLTYVSSTPGGSNAGQTTTWTALSVPANGTLQVTVVATVNTPIASADVRNLTKRTGDPDPVCPSSTCVVTPTAGAVTLAKALTSESGTQAGIAEAGETLTYTITLSNSGGTAASYDLSDTLSAGLTYVSSTPGGSNAGQTTTWTALSVPANGTLQVTVVATVNTPIASADVRNLTKRTGDPDPACPSSTCVVTPTAGAVTLAKALTSESGTQAGIAEAGETLTYTITLSNSGGTAASYDLSDTLSAGLTYVSSTPGGSNAGQTTTWTALSVPANGTLQVTVVATVNTPIASADVRNLTKRTGDPDPACPSSTCVVTPTAGAVTLAKALTSESGTQAGIAEAGETLTYTITLSNSGGTAASYDLSDTLSAGLTYVSSTPGGSNAGQTTTWTALSVPANGTLQVTVVATVNTPIASADVRNLTKRTGDPDPVCPSSTCVVTPTAGAVTLAKALTSESGTQAGIAEAGETLTYTITLSNSGGTAASYDLSDTLSAGLTYVSSTPGGSNAGQTTTWTALSVPANGTLQVTVVVTVNTPIASADVRNLTKRTGDPDPVCPSSTCVVTPTLGQVLLSKALTSESGTQAGIAEAGETLTYTITLSNSGGTAASYDLSDTLSAGLTYVSSTPGGSNAGQTTTWTALSVPANGTLQVTVVATVNTPIASADVRNLTKRTGDPDPVCPSSTCVVTPTAGAVTLAKALTSESGTQAGIAEAGETLTYTITLSNSGGTAASYDLSDTLSAGLTYVSSTPGGSNAGQTTTWTALSVPANGTLQVTVVATVNTPIASADVRNLTKRTGDPDPACPSSTCVVTPTAGAVTLAKALTSESGTQAGIAEAGETLTYTITLSNSGGTAASYDLSDTLSAGLTYVSSTPGGSNAGQTTTWTALSVPANGTLQVTVVATVNTPIASADVRNLTKRTGDPDPVCPSSTCVVTPTAGAVTLAKALTSESGTQAGIAEAGETLTYTITLSNSGGTAASYDLSDTLSAGLTYVSSTPGGSNAGQTTTWTALSVPANGTLQVTVVATVNTPIASADVRNLTKRTGDPDPACPSSTCVVTPTAGAVTLAKALTSESGTQAGIAEAGETLTYTITLSNSGGTAASYDLSDTLSAGLTYVSSTPGGSNAGQTTTWTALSVPANGTLQVTVVATVNTPIASADVRNLTKRTGDPDPVCPSSTCVVTPTAGVVTVGKTSTPAGPLVIGDALTYTLVVTITNSPTSGMVTLTDTLGAGLTFGSVTSAGAFTCNAANPLVCTLPAGTASGRYEVIYTATVNDQAVGSVTNVVVPSGPDGPSCTTCTTTTPVARPVVSYAKLASTTDAVIQGDTITYTLTTTVGNAPTHNALTLTDTLGTGLDFVAVTGSAGYACNAANPLVCTLPAGTAPGTYTVTYTARVNAQASETVDNAVVGTGTDNPTCQGSCITSTPVVVLQSLRVIKQASPRDVKIGDLVRYTVTVENTGTVDATDATLVDTPPAGFSFVDGSLSVADRDGAGRLVGTYPIQVDQVDIAAGERATFTYLLRVGAGVRPGIHTNHALMRDNGRVASNEATANVQLIADPLLDESLILGTVFDDRDGDGWQDSAAMDGIKVQGGFAPEAYVANSTTVDRGAGPTPEPDASSPMLHGIALGSIAGRQSDADPVSAHTVVIRQRLNALSFNDEFTLTTQQGVTVRMDAAGATRIERSGDAAKNLTAAAPTVERRVSQGEGGYVVDYVVSNTGVDERGIPGVRIASVEGLLMETDQYGRYHLEGVDVGTLERGRNFILKVDPATLPPGSVFTTDNPLVRRVTPGLPVRFDWGVKLPAGLIEGGQEQVEMELGEVFFAPGSAEVRAQYLPAVEKMAEQVKRHRGGEVVIVANGDTQSLAFDRASAVKDALIKQLPADAAQALKVSVRGDADDPGSLIVGLGEGGALLGTVLFDTDKSTIKPQFEPLLDKVAKALDSMKGGVIAIVGHTDVRASYEYNTALGMRRAKAVYEALAQRLSPEVRAKVRVESSNDPTAPVGAKRN